MIELENHNTLYFLHIRKTGGTTLLTILMNNFDHDSILKLWDWEELLDNMPKDFSKYQFIHGHFGYRFQQLLPKRPLFMTMLRNPIDLTISNFNEYKRERRDEAVRTFYAGKTIDDVLVDPLERLLYLNLQTRDLASDLLNPYWHQVRDVSNDRLKPFLRTEKQHNDNEIYEGRTERELLAIAKERLKAFVFVGLLERYQESLFLLAYTFGWTPVRSIEAKNAAAESDMKNDFISEQTLKQIRELTALDLELYEFGRQLFEERYDAMVGELKSRYYREAFDKLPDIDMVYQMLQLWYSEIYEKKHPIMVDNTKVDFGSILSGQGWEDREEMQPTKKIFRWTGPETRSIIDLPLKRDNDLRITINLVGYVTEKVLQSFRLKINDENNIVELQMKKNHAEPKFVSFEGIISKSFLQSQYSFTRLIFEVSKTITPSSIDPNSGDGRRLGVAVSDIEIHPLDETV